VSCNKNPSLVSLPHHNAMQSQEKWSSVRITEKKNSMKVENHISIHSNLNLNGLVTEKSGLGKEVKIMSSLLFWCVFHVSLEVEKNKSLILK
jgi:P pilus assembly chaperone PapD